MFNFSLQRANLEKYADNLAVYVNSEILKKVDTEFNGQFSIPPFPSILSYSLQSTTTTTTTTTTAAACYCYCYCYYCYYY